MKLTYKEYWEYLKDKPDVKEYLSMRYFQKTRCMLTDTNKQYIYNSEYKGFQENLY